MSMIGVDYGVLNQRGSPSWFSDIYANIPTAGYKGRMFISTDTFAFYRDTGTGWDLIGGPGTGTITGSGASGQVSYFNGSSTLAGSNNLFWDSTNNRLGIGTATPGVALDIHATGTNAQFNGTGTNNAYLVFQNSGTSKWRIGNTYNAGANSFDIYNNGLTTNAISISSTTNNITLTGGLTIPTLNVTNTTTLDSNILIKKVGLSITTSTYITQFAASSGVGIGYSDGTGGANLIFPTASIYDYTFPASTGTIALTSNLSSYVPYSGATGSVNLGNYDLAVYGLIIGRGGGSVATNTALGYQALYNGYSTQNEANTAIGYRSLYSNTLGQYNTALGYVSLYNNLFGSANTAIGYYSLYTNTGSNNTGTGYRALYLNSTGGSNTAFGMGALDQNSTGSNNTAIGMSAGYGTGTNYNTTGSNNIFIGYQSVGVSSTASNRTFIGNSSTTSTWLGGNLLIGTTTDSGYNLQVTGTGIISQLYINPTNTATTGLDVASDNISFRSDNLEGSKRQLLITMGSGTLIQFTAQGYGANYGTDLAFYTATTSGVNSSPAIYITGTNNRVGIKTGTPSYDLDVSGTGRFTGTLTGAAASFGGNLTVTGNNLFTLAATNVSARIGEYDATNRICLTANQNGANAQDDATKPSWGLVFNANATNTAFIGYKAAGGGSAALSALMTITGAGNVGIGINTPGEKFVVQTTANNWTGNFIGSTTTGQSLGLLITAGTNSTDSAFYIQNSSGSINSFKVRGDTAIFFRASYPFTTGSAANMYLDSSGVIQLSVSSIKYKTDVIDYNKGLNEVLKLRPVSYKSKNSLTDGDKIFAGFIAEEIEELGLNEYVIYDENGNANALAYQNMIALLTKAIQELNEKLIRNNLN